MIRFYWRNEDFHFFFKGVMSISSLISEIMQSSSICVRYLIAAEPFEFPNLYLFRLAIKNEITYI